MKSPYYININGAYGLGAYAKPEYPTLSDLLAEMDRLGVWQVVVSHNNARDLHPVFGNRYLLEDIEKTPGAKARVIPAFAANPSMLAGKGEMEHLVHAFASGSVHCLALFPNTNRFRFLEIERVLEKLEAYDPVIFVDITELGPCSNERPPMQGLDDLVHAAERFPKMRFVVRKVMWWQFSLVLDTLCRSKNIYLDTSWLHTRDAIKIVRDQTSADRLLFGLGAKVHGGAAVSGLSYANIDQTEKDAIAWDNLVSLFSDKAYRSFLTENRKSIPNQVKNRFWNDFADGKGVRDTLVIDMHTHIGPFARSWMLTDNEYDGQIEQLEADMKKLGITKICSQSEAELFGEPIKGNHMLEDAIGSRKDHFCGNLVINPVYAELYTDEVLDGFFAGGYFRGLKLIPEYIGVAIGDPCLAPIFRYADRHHLYILVHSWEGKFGTAQQIADTAVLYPNATFVIGHSGGGNIGRRQSEAIAQDPRYANCRFEFSGSFTSDISWESTLEKIDFHRVLFGTDTIVHDMAWEMGRLLSLDVPDAWLEAILGKNMDVILQKKI